MRVISRGKQYVTLMGKETVLVFHVKGEHLPLSPPVSLNFTIIITIINYLSLRIAPSQTQNSLW